MGVINAMSATTQWNPALETIRAAARAPAAVQRTYATGIEMRVRGRRTQNMVGE